MDERSGSVQGTPATGKIPYKRPLVTRSSPYGKPKSSTPQRSPLSSIFAAPMNYVYQVASKWTSPLASAIAGTNGVDTADGAAGATESPASQTHKRAAENGSQVGITGGAADQHDMQLDQPESSDQINTSIAERVLEACRKDGLGEDKLQAVSSILQASTPVAASTGRQAAAWGQPAKSTPPVFTTTRLSPLQNMSAQLAAQSVNPPVSRSPLLPHPPSATRAVAPRFSPTGGGSIFQEKPPTPFPSVSQMPAFSTGRFARPDRVVNRTRLSSMRTPSHLRPLGTAVRPQGADSDLTGSVFDGAPSISQPSSPRGTSIHEGGVRARGMGRPAAVSWTPMRNITRAQLPSGQPQRTMAVGLKRGAQDISAGGGTGYAGTNTRIVRPRIESRPASRAGQSSGAPAPLSLPGPSGLITAPVASPTPRPPAAPGTVPVPSTETARRLEAALDMFPAARPTESTRLSSLSRPSEPAVLPPPPPTDTLGPSASPLRSSSPAPAPAAAEPATSLALPAPSASTARPKVTFVSPPELPKAFKSLVPQPTRVPTPYPNLTSQAPAVTETPATSVPTSLPDPSSSPPRAKQLDFASPNPATSNLNASSPGSPMFLFPRASSPPTTPPPPATGAALFSFQPPSASGSPPTPSLPAKPAGSGSAGGSGGILSGRLGATDTPSTTAAAGLRFGNGPLADAVSNGNTGFSVGVRGGEAGASSGLFASNGPTAGGRADGKSERTFKFGGKRDSTLDGVLRAAAAAYAENQASSRTYEFGKKRSRISDGTAGASLPPLPSPSVTAKQQMDAKATLAVAATVPLPSDSDDEQPSPPPAQTTAAAAAQKQPSKAPAARSPPAAGGWDMSFLQKSQASMAAASKAVSEEIDKAKGGGSSTAPKTAFTFGSGSSAAAPASSSAPPLFGGLSTPPASQSSAAASSDAAAKPAAPASGGWGAAFLANANASLSKASAAAAEEIEQKKGGAPPAVATTTAAASSQDTGLLSFLGSTAAAPSSITFGTTPASSAPASSFSFGTNATSSTPAPSSSFSFGAPPASTAAASTSAAFSFGASAPAAAPASSTFGGFSSLASTTTAADTGSQPSSGFGFGAALGSSDKTPEVGAVKAGGFGSSGGAFGFGSSTPAFGAGASSGTEAVATNGSGGFSFGVAASQPNADGGSDTPPAIGFGAASAQPFSNGPSAGASQPSSGFSFGSTAPSSTPSLPFPSTTVPTTTFGASSQPVQPDPTNAPAASNGGGFVFGSSSGNALGGDTNTSGVTFGASSAPANGFGFGSSAPASTGGSLFGAQPTSTGAALFGGAGSGSGSGGVFGAGSGQAAASGAGAPPSTSFTFGATPNPFPSAAPAPTFGAAPAPSFGAPAPAPSSTFTFGSNPPADSAPAPSSGFTFGSVPSADPAPAPSSGFAFGGAPAAPAFGGFNAAPAAADGLPGFAVGSTGEMPAKRRILKARRRG